MSHPVARRNDPEVDAADPSVYEDSLEEKSPGVARMEAVTSVFTQWDKALLFVGLFLGACAWSLRGAVDGADRRRSRPARPHAEPVPGAGRVGVERRGPGRDARRRTGHYRFGVPAHLGQDHGLHGPPVRRVRLVLLLLPRLHCAGVRERLWHAGRWSRPPGLWVRRREQYAG